jgi:hypothetical protein
LVYYRSFCGAAQGVAWILGIWQGLDLSRTYLPFAESPLAHPPGSWYDFDIVNRVPPPAWGERGAESLLGGEKTFL